ncbi:hypothetical protein AWJ20_303 [Sugiyamaella lignohabitans]|uniref:Uncharacterized protein n=1 Tax=Sugiyamaella lignohabitans TaxID=796027 RepID=A0A161HKB8_9ASCO|nr:uncharacterized protein AWJ20_303 [Sugiyamaella lignohabitans]ANB12068.1 hypothetical protein AWJ20_303 [Sugiyamaella lignohabitans]
MAIDRLSLVRRHNPTRTSSNPISPLQVGNGHLAFGADITGLQTFVPFSIMSDWGYKSDPLPSEKLSDFTGQTWSTHGRDVKYLMPNEQKELSQWLISNPNRMNLGRIGLYFGEATVSESDLRDCHQELDLWTGSVRSSFEYKGEKVQIQTICDPENDTVSFSIQSTLIEKKKLSIFLDFPYNCGKSKFQAPYVGDWDNPSAHTTKVSESSASNVSLVRDIDGTKYFVTANWNSSGKLVRLKDHRFALELDEGSSVLEVGVTFSESNAKNEWSFQSSLAKAESHWESFWKEGGAIDLSRSKDPRWKELERRFVVGQYAMAINATGKEPPQESGLVNTGWYGKFHTEMVWWHLGYLALLNKWSVLRRPLSVYDKLLPEALKLASSQGYKGARWPKMVDPSGRPSPGEINALLIWQNPHVMLFAELDYRAHPTSETLEKWKKAVFETAEFLEDYAHWNPETQTYDLGSPVHVVSENTDARETYNPSLELQYWRFGLSVAQQWRKRLGIAPNEQWERVLTNLATPHIEDGLYVIWPGIKDMWTKYTWEHPALVGMYGWLPSNDALDINTMKATSKKIWETWHFDECWGWDFGMLAMNAARLGEPEKAIDFLLDPNMPFDDAGLAPGGTQVPFPYLPATGSLLLAVAFMAAGWDDDNGKPSPGFPTGWEVSCEGLHKAI